MSPKTPHVVVKFYKNLRLVTKDVSTVNSHLERKSDEEGEFILAEIEVIGNAGTWNIQWQNGFSGGFTGSLAFNAGAAEVQSALNALGVGTFVVTSLGPQKFKVIWRFSFAFFAGLTGRNIDLSGVMKEVGEFDEVVYFVELTRNFFVGAQVPPSSVEPHGGSGGSKPTDKPITGSRA